MNGELYWFSFAILLMYIVAPLLWLLSHHKKSFIFLSLLLATIGLNVVRDCVPFEITNILQINNFVLYFPFFILGFFVKTCFLKCNIHSCWLSCCIGLAGYIAFLLLMFFGIVPHNWTFIFLLRVCSFVFLWQLFSKIPSNIPLELIGRYSYQIFFLDSFIKVALFELHIK